MQTDSTNSRGALRRELRAARRALTPTEQKAAGQAAARRMSKLPEFQRASRMAFYLASDGELDPWPLLLKAHRAGKVCFLPVLKAGGNAMQFVHYQPGDPLRPNHFGIPEPADVRGRHAPVLHLDLVFTPLVGFDLEGNRLGMGGGFYDRTLAGVARRRRWQRPRVIGLAHECQGVEALPTQSWDVPLHAIVTPKRIIRCAG